MCFLRFLKWMWCRLVYGWLMRAGRRSFCRALYRGGLPSALLVLRNDHIGDYLGSLPAFRELHAYCQSRGVRLVAVVSPASRQLAEHCQWIDAVEIVDQRKFRSVWRILYKIRAIRHLASAYQYIGLINLLSYDRVEFDDALIGALPAEFKIGFALPAEEQQRLPNKKWLFPDVYTKILELRAGQTVSLMELEAIGRWLGQMADMKTLPPGLGVDNLPLSQIPEPAKSFVVVPGNSNPSQRWPVSRFAAVADYVLSRHPDWTCFLCGSTEEQVICGQMLKSMKFSSRVVDLSGTGDLLQLAANLQKTNFVLCNDSGAGHVAGMQGTPIVCILGGPHFGLFQPSPIYPGSECIYNKKACFGCLGRCNKKSDGVIEYPCILEIEVNAVTSAVDKLI